MNNLKIEICQAKDPTDLLNKVTDRQEAPARPQQKRLSSYDPEVIKGRFEIGCS